MPPIGNVSTAAGILRHRVDRGRSEEEALRSFAQSGAFGGIVERIEQRVAERDRDAAQSVFADGKNRHWSPSAIGSVLI